MLQLELAGHIANVGRSFDVRTRTGAFAGVISENFKTGAYKVYFNSSATKGSARKFQTIQDAAAFIIDRRIKKGFSL
jgi:hypothetical protein